MLISVEPSTIHLCSSTASVVHVGFGRFRTFFSFEVRSELMLLIAGILEILAKWTFAKALMPPLKYHHEKERTAKDTHQKSQESTHFARPRCNMCGHLRLLHDSPSWWLLRRPRLSLKMGSPKLWNGPFLGTPTTFKRFALSYHDSDRPWSCEVATLRDTAHSGLRTGVCFPFPSTLKGRRMLTVAVCRAFENGYNMTYPATTGGQGNLPVSVALPQFYPPHIPTVQPCQAHSISAGL